MPQIERIERVHGHSRCVPPDIAVTSTESIFLPEYHSSSHDSVIGSRRLRSGPSASRLMQKSGFWNARDSLFSRASRCTLQYLRARATASRNSWTWSPVMASRSSHDCEDNNNSSLAATAVSGPSVSYTHL